MSAVGIIVAMQKEWDALFADTEFVGCRFADGTTRSGIPYVAMVSGIGKVNAAITAYKLCKEHDCKEVLSFGCAGGMDFEVHVGDVIVGDEYMYYDVYCGSPNAVGQVQGHPETYSSSYEKWDFLKGRKHGLLVTGDTFVEKNFMAESIYKSLYPDHCPLAVDMESAAIAQVCDVMGVGFTSIRVISDNPMSGERSYDAFWKQKDDTLRQLLSRFLQM